MRRLIDNGDAPAKKKPPIGHYGHLRKAYLEATAPTSTPPLSQAKASMSIAPRLKPPSVAALTSLSRSLPRVRAQPRN